MARKAVRDGPEKTLEIKNSRRIAASEPPHGRCTATVRDLRARAPASGRGARRTLSAQSCASRRESRTVVAHAERDGCAVACGNVPGGGAAVEKIVFF
ncbi:hypothetical protein F511_28036 [Dorcoceras hygrometricum]|uniref:Uncharacterized protein n=1 Tax=Dorcoceras hygrometricum TaxID=472368 RepID=A0A2Z7BWD6_9LAMI|nr:hypothetical protein F511_28036 [Dorcoceras hygrometricum]